MENLSIPDYQRPYKWTEKNINQLFEDIDTHKKKRAYRLGTLVFHESDEKLNIVDGQQRTISLMLAVRALINERMDEKSKDPITRKDLRDALAILDKKMFEPSFESLISITNLHKNYLVISRIISRPNFNEDLIDFLLHKCEVVYFILSDISEAFQFFDSQNARGRDLEPHDLLKAFHLREFSEKDEQFKSKVVSEWEKMDSDKLAKLFSNYLFRIRSWSRGSSARFFGKEQIWLFKGVNLDRIQLYPYVKQLRIAHHFVDAYNQDYQRKIDNNYLDFPFHLDQIIINGRRFFEMIGHYQKSINDMQMYIDQKLTEDRARKIFETINSYEGRNRTGDRFVRSLFDSLLITYIDKFGMTELSRAIEKIFIWAWRLRLEMQVLQLATMDNYVLENNMFLLIKEATVPEDFLVVEFPIMIDEKVKATKVKPIKDLFRELRYSE